ncbi:MAG: hypothetical protein IJV40_04365 [Oscillospiraceae bacterium]|nr:hypothetical protein [Oscillospiraceae bacterium]
MMKGKNLLKRLSAMLLCAVLFLSLLPVGNAAFTLSAPTLVSVEKQGESLVITWNKVDGAASYGVWRKTNGGSWQSVAQRVSGSSYKDTTVSGGNTYTYTVRCLDGSGALISWFDEAGLSMYYDWPYATPTLTSGTATGNSFTVKWSGVAGAKYYAIFRKDNGSSWQTVKRKVTGTSYTDYNVKTGHTYVYTVRVEDENGKLKSWFNEAGVSDTVTNSSWGFATPVLKSAVYVSNGVNITWDAVKDAPKYAIYRKTNYTTNPNAQWQRIGTTTSTSYTDTTTNSGNTYLYTVRIIDNNNRFVSWFDESGIAPTSGATFATPVLQSVTNTSNGVKFVWSPVPAAKRYTVFRRDNGGNWHAVNRNVTSNSYVDSSVTAGTTYTYTVRVTNDAGQLVSGFQSPGLEIRYWPCATPNFTLTSTKEGVKITWNKVSGASSYRIFRLNDGKWVSIASVSGTSYTDKQVVSSKDYTYAVRAQDGSKKLLSWFDQKTITYYGELNIVTKLSYGEAVTGPTDSQFLRGRSVVVEWRNINGAATYRIFRKANNASEWKELTTYAGNPDPAFQFYDVPATDPRQYIDTQVVSGTTYTYTVRALDAAGKYVGEYDSVGRSIVYYDAPDVFETVADNDGITVSWNPVLGISKYQVYRKIRTAEGWDLIGSTSDLYFTDTNIIPQTEYQYTVRCVNNSNQIVSGFDRQAEFGRTTMLWLNTPVLIDISLDEDTVSLTWMRVDWIKDNSGVSQYEVLRKLNDESWQHVDFVMDPGTSPVDKITYKDTFSSMVSGATYHYTVRCVDMLGMPLSNYDKDGLTISFYEVPKVMKIENHRDGVYLEWNVTDGTAVYQVYRKNGDNNWIKIGTTTETHYTDTTAVNSLTYVYAVSSKDEGDELLSDYFKDNRISNEITYYKTPELISVRIEGNGLRVKWAPVDGITQYRLYRKTVGEEGTTYVDVSDVTYWNSNYDMSTLGPVESGKTYTYTVRCIDGSGIVSEYESNLLKSLYLDMPTPWLAIDPPGPVVRDGNNAAIVRWNAVVGAEKYKIFRKDPDHEGWFTVGVVDGNIAEFKDTNDVREGQAYDYTVRAVSGDTESAYDESGWPLPA